VTRTAIAVATKFFAVGARVPNIEPQKGAVCTQALTNPLYGPHGLRLNREGRGRCGRGPYPHDTRCRP
jgi:uncharacterized Ntn-hydrolase superfamily protein